MMESTFKVPDDDDLEFVFILQSLGMQRNVAVLITYLGSAGETTSREIEQATGLRQPEVSIAMQGLRGANWIDEREVKTGGKGRPSAVYTLNTPLSDIIKRIEDEKLRELADAMENYGSSKRCYSHLALFMRGAGVAGMHEKSIRRCLLRPKRAVTAGERGGRFQQRSGPHRDPRSRCRSQYI